MIFLINIDRKYLLSFPKQFYSDQISEEVEKAITQREDYAEIIDELLNSNDEAQHRLMFRLLSKKKIEDPIFKSKLEEFLDKAFIVRRVMRRACAGSGPQNSSFQYHH